MAISLDHAEAEAVLRGECAAARLAEQPEATRTWERRVRELAALCPPRRSATVIAALGTALLAKATDIRIDVRILLDRHPSPGAYSARSLADGVLAPHRAELGLDLGANGVNPLNNAPFLQKASIDEIRGVRNQAGWACFLSCIAEAGEVRDLEHARLALRGFVIARTFVPPAPLRVAIDAGDELSMRALAVALTSFVDGDSEGGRRAQACVAGILDAVFHPERILVSAINDPDRRSPLDIAVTDPGGMITHAFEVKDKPIKPYHVSAAIAKTQNDHAQVRNLVFVALRNGGDSDEFEALCVSAARQGLSVSVFSELGELLRAAKCFATQASPPFEGRAFRAVLRRAEEMGARRESIEALRTVGSLLASPDPA